MIAIHETFPSHGKRTGSFGTMSWASTGFTPSGSPICWLPADVITGLSDDGDLTTWSDQSGNGNDAAQTVAARKPHYKESLEDYNSLPGVEFNQDQNMFLTGMTAPSGNYTFFFVLTPNSQANIVHGIFDCLVDRLVIETGLGTANLRYYNGAYRGTQDSINEKQILVCRLEATDKGCFYRNGALVEEDLEYDALEFTDGAITLGSHFNEVNEYKGTMAEVIIYDSALSDADMATNVAGLNTKYAIY